MSISRGQLAIAAIALLAGAVFALVSDLGAKVEAEPAYAMQMRIQSGAIIAGVTWLVLSLVRFFVLMRKEKADG